ncbi:MAG: PEGA domain-containing protein [Deltaproteobacteria bacterium]|nr:PEGA domain-containing protein [Deltaproteobacteria bacterium]
MRLRVTAALLASALVFASAPARAGDPAAAREQVKIGYELAQKGKCDEAIPHFVESIKLDVKAVTLINLAACEEKTGKLADALGHWVEARARAQAENNAAIQEEAEKKAKALEGRLPKLTVTLPASAPKDAEVVRDGVVLGAASFGVALPVNPGAHTLVVKAKGYEDASTTVTIAEAEARSVELKLGAPKPPEPLASGAAPASGAAAEGASGPGTLAYVGFGMAAVGLGVGTVTGVLALGAASEAEKNCPGGVCANEGQKSDAESGKTMGTISTIGFVVAGVGAAIGIYGLVWGTPKSSASVAVSVGPTGGVVRGTF